MHVVNVPDFFIMYLSPLGSNFMGKSGIIRSDLLSKVVSQFSVGVAIVSLMPYMTEIQKKVQIRSLTGA